MSENLLKALFDGNTKDARYEFEKAMDEKQTQALDVKRVATTSKIFNREA